MKTFKRFINENNNEITIQDVAWLDLLHNIYGGKLKISEWKNDSRMGPGTTIENSLSKFDCVKSDDLYYLSSPECANIIDKYFGAKTIEEALEKQKDLKKYDTEGYYGYIISTTPYINYMRKHPKIKDNFERIVDRITDHYNSQISSDKIIGRLSKSKNLKEWNLKTLFEMFDGNIPDTITIYRGLKDTYDPSYESIYSCWTTSKSEAERFAKYEFTGGKQFKPIYANIQYLLIAEVKIDDILVAVGGSESEIIMKNPIEIKEIINLKAE